MALLILALLQRIFLMSSLMLLLVWLIFFMVLIKLLPILGTISGKTVKLMVLALICLGNNRQDCHPPNCMFSCLQILEAFLWFRSEERRVGKECRSDCTWDHEQKNTQHTLSGAVRGYGHLSNTRRALS